MCNTTTTTTTAKTTVATTPTSIMKNTFTINEKFAFYYNSAPQIYNKIILII